MAGYVYDLLIMICSGPSKGIGSVLMIERLVPVHLECALCCDRTQCLVVPKQTAWQCKRVGSTCKGEAILDDMVCTNVNTRARSKRVSRKS